jgi:adenylate cyclase
LLLGDEKQVTVSKEGRLSWRNGHIDLGPDGVPLIRWYGQGMDKNHPVYPEISFLDIVLSEMTLECQESHRDCRKTGIPTETILSPDHFKDKYVLIGGNLPYGSDKHTTIYGPNYSGIYILANLLDNAIHNNFVHKAPAWLDILCLILLPTLLLLTIYRYRSAWLSLMVAAALALGHFLFTMYAYSQWNLWVAFVHPFLAVVVCFSGTYAYQYAIEHKKRQQMRYAFGKYVSPSVLQIIEQNPDKITLGGERREMTFLFSDIRGFTSFSDQHPPEEVQLFLSQYFSTMNKIILHAYHGSINKLIGDAIMAYWGFPLQNEDHAFLAVSAALAMKEAMLEWQTDTSKLPITIGIGINTGEAVIGNIGSEDFMDFTVIGDAVNVASRLEGSNKEYGTNIIISAATYEKVKDRIHARRLGWADLKGKEAKVEIYEPLGFL